MKTFTSTQLNKSPAQVFRAADQEGKVKINHDRYPDKVFIMEGRERGWIDCSAEESADRIQQRIANREADDE